MDHCVEARALPFIDLSDMTGEDSALIIPFIRYFCLAINSDPGMYVPGKYN